MDFSIIQMCIMTRLIFLIRSFTRPCLHKNIITVLHIPNSMEHTPAALGTSWQRCRSSQLWFWTAEMVRWRLVGHCRKITQDCGEGEVTSQFSG